MENQEITIEERTLLDNAKMLLGDPETRDGFFGLLKKKKPDMAIPERDVKDSLEALLATERTAREKLENEMKEDRARQEVKERRAKLIGKGLNEADITEVEKVMTEKGIISHDTAADYLLNSRKLAEASAPDGGRKSAAPNPAEEIKTTYGGNVHSFAKATALADMRAFRQKAA